MLETSPFLGNPQKRTIFLLRKKQVRVSPPPSTWDYSSYLISALFFISEDKCWTCIIWRKRAHTHKHTGRLSLSLKECEWGGEWWIQSLAHRRQSGRKLRSPAFEVEKRGACRPVSGGWCWGVGGPQKEQDGTLAVYCAGFVDLPESWREAQSLGTQAWPGLRSGNRSNFWKPYFWAKDSSQTPLPALQPCSWESVPRELLAGPLPPIKPQTHAKTRISRNVALSGCFPAHVLSWNDKATFEGLRSFKVRHGGDKDGLIWSSEPTRKLDSSTPLWTVLP